MQSAINRGSSMAVDVWGKLNAGVMEKGGSYDALQILASTDGAGLINVIAELLVEAELKTRHRFLLQVDYTKSLADMVQAVGCDHVNNQIVANNFPMEGIGLVELELILVEFGYDISSRKAIKEMEKIGLLPCKIEHLLALGAKYPDLQNKYPIICFGSSWRRSVPLLCSWVGNRNLDLCSLAGLWGGECRFAAVRPRAICH